MAAPEVVLLSAPPESDIAADTVRAALKERYGVYNVALLGDTAVGGQVEDRPAPPLVRVEGSAVTFAEGETVGLDSPAEFDTALSTFARDHLRFGTEALSCRDNHADLERFIAPDGSLDVLADPRPWILGNAFVGRLVERDQTYLGLVEFVSNKRGLFLKPSMYKNQRNHWNAPTNGGLPIVRKRDPIHEGTFMAHDLEHFAIQDPLPFSLSDNPEMMRTYLRHRMASEAATLVLTDMLAVHIAGLKEEGYDTTKRRIFPLFESLQPYFESEGFRDFSRDLVRYKPLRGQDARGIADKLMDANIYFALTGETDRFEAMGADPEALAAYVDKYEVFFSADYDWNKENFHRVRAEVAANPRMRDYFTDVQEDYGIPLVEDLYPEGVDVATITSSFNTQVFEAFSYWPSVDDPFFGRQQAAIKYLAGQQVAFYRFHDIDGADVALKEFRSICMELKRRNVYDDPVAHLAANFAAANRIYQDFIARCADTGRIGPQEHRLYVMHAPLYPPLFINYAKEGGDYRNLKEKMTADGVYGRPQLSV